MKKSKHQSETAILRSIREYLRMYGWFVVRIQQGLGAYRGISDLVALKNSKTLWIEVKTPTGKLSSHQKEFARHVLQAGGVYVVVRSIEDIDRVIKANGCLPFQRHIGE